MNLFADRLIDATRRKGNPLCVGLDPFVDKIPAMFGSVREDPTVLARFGEEVLNIAAHHAGVFKPQLGLFEPFGPDGVRSARYLVSIAIGRGMVTILDAKRGDIGSTADGYADAMLGPLPGFDADCVTINPYLGMDAIEPFLKMAERKSKGVAVLARTSNPGARDLQDLDCGGAPLWQRTAEMLAPHAKRLKGESGWSGLMIVAGATYPDEARTLREVLPDSLFLVPGYGAQGAGAADAVAGFITGKYGREGGVVSSSRALTYPLAAQSAASMADWRAAVSDAMQAAAAELKAACAA